MSLWNTVAIAVRALRRNGMRTALTALGMIIGVAAVIVMVAIGTGARTSIETQVKSAGTNIVNVLAGAGFGPVRGGQGATTTLTPADAEAIRRLIPGIRYMSPGLNTRTQVVSEHNNWNRRRSADAVVHGRDLGRRAALLRLRRGDRHLLRLLSGAQGGRLEPDRRVAVRVVRDAGPS
jgi:ABC-type lipoprotein release transport system permease subunit